MSVDVSTVDTVTGASEGGWVSAGVCASFLASAVALSIAGWGERNRRRAERATQLTNARSVVGLAHPYDTDEALASVEIVNGSPEPILDVLVVKGEVDVGRIVEWGMHHTATGVTAILGGASERLPGSWLIGRDSGLASVSYPTIHYLIRWTDARGQRWERDGTATPRRVGPTRAGDASASSRPLRARRQARRRRPVPPRPVTGGRDPAGASGS